MTPLMNGSSRLIASEDNTSDSRVRGATLSSMMDGRREGGTFVGLWSAVWRGRASARTAEVGTRRVCWWDGDWGTEASGKDKDG